MRRTIAMARQAGRAIASRCRLVRRVTARARRVLRHAMEAGQLRPVVAALARRRRDLAARAMRAVTARAGERDPVLGLGVRRVTARAARGGAAWIVGLMTARASLVSRRRGGCLGAMAARTRGRRRRRSVLGAVVTAGAVAVAGALGRRHPIGMAARAQRRGGDRRRAVGRVAGRAARVTGPARGARAVGVAARTGHPARLRLAGVSGVTVEARRGGVLRRRMAGRTGLGLRAREHGTRVHRMTARAAAGRRRRVFDLLRMAARARARPVVVGRVAGRARGVCARGEHGLARMTRLASHDLRGAEPVRLVTAGALRMTRGERLGILVERSAWQLRVAARASLIGDELGLVHAVAIETAASAGVLRHVVGVAPGARLRIERGRLVGMMASTARLRRVRTDGVHRPLRLVVTAQAARRVVMIGAERVAVAAARRGRAAMERRGDPGMAALAHRGRRRREPGLAVTLGAGELADVRRVSRARADVAVGDRDLVRDAVLARTRAADPEADDREHEQPDHRAPRAPTA